VWFKPFFKSPVYNISRLKKSPLSLKEKRALKERRLKG
jgi:hypothetical protein